MRVAGGHTKGRRLQSVAGRDVRPTAGKVREALFDTLRDRVAGSVFVDMFAGTGSVGLEALSQGARHVYFVENDRRALDVLRANVRHCGFEPQATVVAAELPKGLERLPVTPHADVIFMDPPYASDLARATLGALDEHGLLSFGALVVWQHAARRAPDALPGQELVLTKRYGNTQLSFLAPLRGTP